MNAALIKLMPDNQILHFVPGATIMETLLAHGIFVDNAICGGRGLCGKCILRITRKKENGLSEDSWCLACKTKCLDKMEVWFEQSNPNIIHVPEIMSVPLSDNAAPAAGELGVALDIGTTTISAGLFDLQTGNCLSSTSAINPQVVFGADVISRISTAQKNSENAVQLVTVLREAVRDTIIILLRQAGRQAKELLKVMLAGNSVITHFFLKLETVQLGRTPFSTIIHEAQTIKLADGGIPELQVFANAVLTTIPLISGFLGGDAVAAGIAAGLHCLNSSGGTILYDFGTNCEILLEVKGTIYGASAAAGPAFEGYNISSGMRYAVGAVSKVTEDHGIICFDVIGGGYAKGFCGSALLDLLAIMISAGHVDRKGNLKCNIEYQGENNHYKYYAAADAEGVERKILFTDKQNQQTLTLTLQDIRNLQLAKGAISAAVAILLKAADITENELSTVKIAGVFGNGLQTGAARALGVLAGTADMQVDFVKDAALLGVSMCMLHENIFDEAKLFARRVNSIDLIEDTDFLATYIRCLQF